MSLMMNGAIYPVWKSSELSHFSLTALGLNSACRFSGGLHFAAYESSLGKKRENFHRSKEIGS
jgi:hypothetical protein